MFKISLTRNKKEKHNITPLCPILFSYIYAVNIKKRTKD
ncbi:hypothetical protein bcere0002_1370 [Bacillus cereus ATCC 10876]|nr:hypothetical protein bcere0002_1370 [Bacillus cereus ATCC 10876]